MPRIPYYDVDQATGKHAEFLGKLKPHLGRHILIDSSQRPAPRFLEIDEADSGGQGDASFVGRPHADQESRHCRTRFSTAPGRCDSAKRSFNRFTNSTEIGSHHVPRIVT